MTTEKQLLLPTNPGRVRSLFQIYLKLIVFTTDFSEHSNNQGRKPSGSAGTVAQAVSSPQLGCPGLMAAGLSFLSLPHFLPNYC